MKLNIPGGVWVDIFALSGITAGTSLAIRKNYNKARIMVTTSNRKTGPESTLLRLGVGITEPGLGQLFMYTETETTVDVWPASPADSESLDAYAILSPYNSDSVKTYLAGIQYGSVHVNSKYGLKGNGEDLSAILAEVNGSNKVAVLEPGNYKISTNVVADRIMVRCTDPDKTKCRITADAALTGYMLKPKVWYYLDGIFLWGAGVDGQYAIGSNEENAYGNPIIRNTRFGNWDIPVFFDDAAEHPLGILYEGIYIQTVKTAGIVIGGKGGSASSGEDGFTFDNVILTNATTGNTTYAHTVTANTPSATQDTITWSGAVPYFGYLVLRSSDNSTNWHVPPNWSSDTYTSQSFVANKTSGETWFYKVVRMTIGVSIARAKCVAVDVGHSEYFGIGYRFKNVPVATMDTSYYETRDVASACFTSIYANGSNVMVSSGWCENSGYYAIAANNGSVSIDMVTRTASLKWGVVGECGATDQYCTINSVPGWNGTTPLVKAMFGGSNEQNYNTTVYSNPKLKSSLSHSNVAELTLARRGVDLLTLTADADGGSVQTNRLSVIPANKTSAKPVLVNANSGLAATLTNATATPIATFQMTGNGGGSLTYDYCCKVVDGGAVVRQVSSGRLVVNYVNPAGGGVVANVQGTASTLASQGTLTDPVFTCTVSGDTVTLLCNTNSSIAGASIKCYLTGVSMLGGTLTGITLQ